MAEASHPSHDPYCGNCGYKLSGLTESSKCPECGKPLVEVLTRTGGLTGRRYRTSTTLFGMPIVDVAFGPALGEKRGNARGVLAFGDHATGLVAVGGRAIGIVAIGGLAIGLFSIGGLSLGLLAAWGGVATGLMANGGLAIGFLASGGLAVGYCAGGGLAIGNYAFGGSAIGPYGLGPGRNDQEAFDMLQQFSWFFGPSGTFTPMTLIQPLLAVLGVTAAATCVIGMLAATAHAIQGRHKQY